MAKGFSYSTMRDLSQESSSLGAYVDSLNEEKTGNIDPLNKEHAPLLNTVTNAILQGSLTDEQAQKLIRMNRKAAPVWAAALDEAKRSPDAIRREVLPKYFQPERNTPTLKENAPDELGLTFTGSRITPSHSDPQGAITEFLSRGETGLAKELGFGSTTRAGEPPSAVQEWEYLKKEFPQLAKKWTFDDYLNVKRKGFDIKDIGNVPTLVGTTSPTAPVKPLSTLPKEAEGAATVAGAEAEAKATAEKEVNKKYNQNKIYSALESAEAKNKALITSIDEAVPKVNYYTAGMGGVALDKIAGTEARDLRAKLDSIKANLGFDELQEMRANSPNGSALGSITENEIKYLQSVSASLDSAQSPRELQAAMLKAKKAKEQSNKRIRAAYEREYGKEKIPKRLRYNTGSGKFE